MKRALPLAALLLFACSDGGQPAAEPPAAEAPSLPPVARARAPEPLSVECSIGGAAFARACMVDQTQGEEGVILTIRNPEGGFRRLLVTPDGRVAAADGAEPADATMLSDGRVEVAVGGDLYRIPAPAGFGAGR